VSGARWEFGVRVDDPRQALDDLASTIVLLEDFIDLTVRIIAETTGVAFDDAVRLRRELAILSRRLQAIHARLST
jgi:hypothetical protein